MKVKTKVNVSLELTVDEQRKLKSFLRAMTSTRIRPIVSAIEEEDKDIYLSPYEMSDLLVKVGNVL